MAGFNWDGEEYTPGEAGGDFITEEEYNKLLYTEAVVFVTGIRDGVSNYNNKPKEQYLVDFIDPNGEEKTKGYDKGISERDARMERLRATLAAAPDDPIEASFVKVGRRNDVGPPKK